MNELPPDSARLHAILTHLDKELADNETVGTYLRLQRDAVRQALAAADGARPQQPQQSRATQQLAALPSYTPRGTTGYMVQQKRTPKGPEPAMVHTDDCTMAHGRTHSISAHDARVALTDPNIEARQFCRPDTELGVDVV